MIIPTSKIIESIECNWENYGFSTINDIQDEDLIILLLCVLYHNKIIKNKQLVYYCSNVKSLNRTRKTYHCPFNDKWYNDCNFLGVLCDVINTECHLQHITTNEYLNYLNIGFNKNRNWCVNYIAFNWVYPLINDCFYGREYDFDKGKILQHFGVGINIQSYEDVEYELSNGYCCSDCDGCLSEYKKTRYQYRYAPKRTDILRQFGEQLILYKKNTRQPFDRLRDVFELT